jgi:tetratricopeptide (TPR) repeat protein
MGQPEEALRRFEDALALAEAGEDTARQAEILLLFGLILRNQGRPAKAPEYVNRALELYRVIGDKAGEADALGMLGTVYRDLRQPDLALEQIRRAADISEELGNSESQAEMRMVTASVYRRQGRLDEALATAEEALTKAEATGDRGLFVDSLSVLGDIHYRLRQHEKALLCHQRRLAIEEETGNRIGQASALSEIGWLHREQKRYAAALDAYRQTLAIHEELGNEIRKAKTLRHTRFVDYSQRFGERALLRTPGVTPLAVEVGVEPAPRALDETGQFQNSLDDRIAAMRDRVWVSTGVLLPVVKVRTNQADLKPGEYLILLDETAIVRGPLQFDKRLYPGPLDDLAALGAMGETAVNPQNGEPAVWVAQEHWQALEAAGKPRWDATEYLARNLDAVVRKNLGEFIGHQETMDMLGDSLPDVARRMRENPVDLSILVAVLKNLLEEFAPIIPFGDIVETFIQLRAQGAERLDLLRAVRRLPEVRPGLPGNHEAGYFYSLGARFEEKIAGSIRVVGLESFLAMEPEETQRALSLIREMINRRPDVKNVALLTSNPTIRRFVRRLVELEFPYFFVLSREELLPGLEARIVDEIEW